MELYAPCSPQGEVKFRVRLGMLLLPRLKPFGGVNVVNDVIEAVVVYYFRYVGVEGIKVCPSHRRPLRTLTHEMGHGLILI